MTSASEKLVAALCPTVTFDTIETALDEATDVEDLVPALAKLAREVAEAAVVEEDTPIEDLASALAMIEPKVELLRLPDLLFCAHEGPPEELARRRRRLWDLALKPLVADLCPRRKLTELEHTYFVYLWTASAGPQLSIRQG